MAENEIVKTVKIKAGDSFAVINASDFDKEKHEKYEEPEEETGGAGKAPSDMTVKELKAALKAKGIDFDTRASHDDLVKLLEDAQ